jgi:hypothetical protein
MNKTGEHGVESTVKEADEYFSVFFGVGSNGERSAINRRRGLGRANHYPAVGRLKCACYSDL